MPKLSSTIIFTCSKHKWLELFFCLLTCLVITKVRAIRNTLPWRIPLVGCKNTCNYPVTMLLVYTIGAIFVYDISYNPSCNSNSTPCRVALNRMQQEWFRRQLSPCSQKLACNSLAMVSSFINFCSWARVCSFIKGRSFVKVHHGRTCSQPPTMTFFALLIPQWVLTPVPYFC